MTSGTYPTDLGAERVAIALSGAAVTFGRGARKTAALSPTTLKIAEGVFTHDLTFDGHVVRWSGAEREEEAFVACSFWMVAARAWCGQVDLARERMEHLVATVPNDVGIMAEMIEPATGAFAGNLPQALSHLALVNAALTIQTVERDGLPDEA